MFILTIILIIFILYAVFEYKQHQKFRNKIPLVIHINGTRGKSSVTRLIAAGLQAGNIRTIAKTTGSAPRIILENGNEIPIVRYFGANIKEQLKIFRFASRRNIDALVLECMAINPEYQWITEQKMTKSDIGVITNIRLDHLDLMGPGIKNVAKSLCNTLPKNGKAFTCEQKLFPFMKKVSDRQNIDLQFVESNNTTDEDMKVFPYIEHKENVALALEVCDSCGVKKEIALNGMKKVNPDIGATQLFILKKDNKEIYFAHSFAANDPESTTFVMQYIKNLHKDIEFTGIVLNTRADRMFRSKQLIRMLNTIQFDMMYLIGEQTSTIKSYAIKHNISQNKICNLGWIKGSELIKQVIKVKPKRILLIGIGNIGGNGGIIVKYFSEK
ncbi:MAG: poly-gamma-glutamate synthase PgsB [Candidatus Cloacimonetes bacterium]|nr:poly-gamma-glutamate synthase PgsB [Candidatus Cloacimonadota bacterium]